MISPEAIAARLHGTWDGRRSTLRCPSHEDRLPSLSMKLGAGGQILLYCFAGCELDDILDALGLELNDLFPSPRKRRLRPSIPMHPRLVPLIRRYQRAKRKEKALFDSAFAIFFPTLAHFTTRRYRELIDWCTAVDIREKLNAH